MYCSITGFGLDGPYAPRAGYDFIVQGMSGIMDLTGEPDGAPQKIGVAFADIMTGLYSVIAIQAALAMRERTGKGQQIDMALLDTMTGVLANQAMNWFASGVSPTRVGNAHMNVCPYAVFPCADGWFILAVGNDGQFRRFCDAMGLPEMRDDPRFATNAGRLAFKDLLFAGIEAATSLVPKLALLARLEAVGCPGRADQYCGAGFRRSAGRRAGDGDRRRAAGWVSGPGAAYADPVFGCRSRGRTLAAPMLPKPVVILTKVRIQSHVRSSVRGSGSWVEPRMTERA